jgi:hypothetical protein
MVTAVFRSHPTKLTKERGSMRITHFRRWIGALAIALTIGGMAWSFAPDAATSGALLHPSDAVVYFAFDGGIAHEADFKKTAAYDALYQSGLMETMTKVAARVKDMAGGEISAKDAERIAKALELGKEALDRGVSFSAVVAPPAGGPPTASATLVLNQCGKYRGVIEASLKEGLAGERDVTVEPFTEGGKTSGVTLTIEDGPMGAKITLFEKSGHLIVNAASTVGGNSPAREISFRAINGQGKNISSHRLYKDGATERNFVQNGIGWIDFQPLKQMFGGMPLPPTRTGQQMTVGELLETLGLNSLEAIVSRSGFKDRATWAEASVIAPGPRKGLLALIDQPTFTLADLPPLPSKPLNIFATGLDAGAIYDRLVGVFKDVSAKIEPQAIDQFDQALAQVEAQIGFGIRQDLLGPFKGVMALSVDGGGSQSFDSLLISLQVADQARLKTTLEKVFGMVSELSRGEVVFEKTSKYGREMSVMKIRQAPILVPTICVDKKFVHIGLLPQAIDMALLRADGKLPTWKPTGDTAEGLKLLPTSMTGLSFSDTPMMYSRLIGQAPMLLGFVQMGMAQANPGMEFPLKAEDLPPAELVAASLFPNLSVSTVDKDGAKSYSRTSLPGSELFISTGGASVMVALLLPAVQQAREAARRTQSKNNLKQIMLALHNYHDTFNKFPTGTMPHPMLKPDERLSWLAMILPFVEQAPLWNRLDQKGAWNKGANEALTRTTVPFFLHPTMLNQEPGVTNYVGLAGIGEKGPILDARDPKAGAFAYDKPRGIRDFTDGTSNTLMVIESNRATPWAAGGPSTIRPLTQQPYIGGPDGFGGVSPGGANAALADGSVRFLSDKIDPTVMEALTTIGGGEVVNDF